MAAAFLGGGVGSVGRVGGVRRSLPDFALSAAAVTTAWGTVTIGDLIPSSAPAGVTFRLVNEPAGLAVVNG